jgi:predicted AAA+ superfamily ATPase
VYKRQLLARARVIERVTAASPAGLPLAASADDSRFKATLLDVGLMHRLNAVPHDIDMARASLLSLYGGALAEQFVGQELRAALPDPAIGGALHYWARTGEARGSTAEVDYLVPAGGRIVPIEVKSGPSGKLRSLHLLLKTYPRCAPGMVLSEAPFAELPEQGLVFMPLYYAGTLASLSDSA